MLCPYDPHRLKYSWRGKVFRWEGDLGLKRTDIWIGQMCSNSGSIITKCINSNAYWTSKTWRRKSDAIFKNDWIPIDFVLSRHYFVFLFVRSLPIFFTHSLCCSFVYRERQTVAIKIVLGLYWFLRWIIGITFYWGDFSFIFNFLFFIAVRYSFLWSLRLLQFNVNKQYGEESIRLGNYS